MDIKKSLIFIIIFCYGQEVSSQLADYWIIENPSALLIYNSYQQRLTEKDKNLLPQFSAWRIIEEDYTLSDQFTHTIKTEINQNTYFIQLSGDGWPVNSDLAGQIEKYRNARVQGDTVRILNTDQLSLQSADKQLNLLEGMLIKRLFVYDNRTYARDIVSNFTGWVEGNGPAHWEIYLPSNSTGALEKKLFIRVDQIFKSYNMRLDKLFTYLNKRYSESKTSPQWVSDKSSEYLTYMLVPREYINRFSGSQFYLIQELNDLLYGSNYRLTASDGQIVISASSR